MKKYKVLLKKAFNRGINRIDFYEWGHLYASAKNYKEACKHARAKSHVVVRFYHNTSKEGWAVLKPNEGRSIIDYPSTIKWIKSVARKKKAA